ncbi:Dynein heavy chain-like protein [Portunus trituberculatus]|uniref:Dynein heavy chain-like protein n=1 Tax=Portunus trituberculatus TaxID=210409 RepID=A0A5B7FDA6_PORTR|nr:Dynein heavy chain-like protein [Portunus trituberculatus]
MLTSLTKYQTQPYQKACPATSSTLLLLPLTRIGEVSRLPMMDLLHQGTTAAVMMLSATCVLVFVWRFCVSLWSCGGPRPAPAQHGGDALRFHRFDTETNRGTTSSSSLRKQEEEDEEEIYEEVEEQKKEVMQEELEREEEKDEQEEMMEEEKEEEEEEEGVAEEAVEEKVVKQKDVQKEEDKEEGVVEEAVEEEQLIEEKVEKEKKVEMGKEGIKEKQEEEKAKEIEMEEEEEKEEKKEVQEEKEEERVKVMMEMMEKVEVIQEDEEEKEGVQWEEEREGDEEFLRRHVPFLESSKVQFLDNLGILGRGSHGTVWLVHYEGELAARKELLPFCPPWDVLREARVALQLDGAGGVPRTLAVCLRPPIVLLEYVGDVYVEYLDECSVGGFLDSLVNIAVCLQEIHRSGIVHNDLKVDNITFTGRPENAVFHIIDVGLACRVGEAMDTLAGDMDEEKYWWIAPEVLSRQPVFPSADVYSFGALVHYVIQECDKQLLKKCLECVIVNCTQRQSLSRPSLSLLVTQFMMVKAKLPKGYVNMRLKGEP